MIGEVKERRCSFVVQAFEQLGYRWKPMLRPFLLKCDHSKIFYQITSFHHFLSWLKRS